MYARGVHGPVRSGSNPKIQPNRKVIVLANITRTEPRTGSNQTGVVRFGSVFSIQNQKNRSIFVPKDFVPLWGNYNIAWQKCVWLLLRILASSIRPFLSSVIEDNKGNIPFSIPSRSQVPCRRYVAGIRRLRAYAQLQCMSGWLA